MTYLAEEQRLSDIERQELEELQKRTLKNSLV
jgi:hypothetical protein